MQRVSFHGRNYLERLPYTLLCIVFSVLSFGIAFAAEEDPSQPLSRPQRGIPLLEPLDGSPRGTVVPSSAGIEIFFTYFNAVWPWLLGTAAGIAVLRALIGGIRIMLSGSDSGMREEGKSNITWALVGLLIIGLAGLILETINPFFYVQS